MAEGEANPGPPPHVPSDQMPDSEDKGSSTEENNDEVKLKSHIFKKQILKLSWCSNECSAFRLVFMVV